MTNDTTHDAIDTHVANRSTPNGVDSWLSFGLYSIMSANITSGGVRGIERAIYIATQAPPLVPQSAGSR